MGRFFRTDGKYLGRAYKEHLSGFGHWEQKRHAHEWMLLEKNMGERLSIDETALQHDLFTFLSNKDGHGRKGTLVAAVKGTTVADVARHLDKIPEESRRKVKEVTMDFSDSMMGIVKKEFPQAEIVIDLFHVMQLFGTKGLDAMRMKLKRKALILASQLPIKDWYNVFKSELIAEACLDRIVHKSKRFELKGESLRKKY